MRITCLIALLPLVACGRGPGDRDDYTLRDSAGMTITHAVQPFLGDELRLASGHVVEVPMGGHTTGGVHRTFGRALGTHDGGVLVAGGSEQSIRRYDAAGRLADTWTLAESVHGPFRGIQGFMRADGDTVLVTDGARDRLTFLAPDGSISREEPLRWEEEGAGAPFGYLRDGAVMMRMFPSTEEAPVERGVWRPTVRITHRPGGASAGTTVASLPGGEVVILERDGGVQVVDRAFGLCTCLVPLRDGFVYGTGETAELVRYHPDGRMRNRIRWTAGRRSVGRRDIAAHRNRELAASDDSAATAAALAAMDYPDRMPVFDMVVASVYDDLWVRRYEPDPERDALWWVFEPQGRMLYAIPVPGRLRIHEAASDYVVGVWRDAAGVETVRRYALVHALD